ncbi:DUF3267 domain-containing protein [Cytobacillus sp. S13-E01]|uniref:DUF3267 domain-containing protein n=1 Tax=Cytobacillus sp. S13-E01 TaxID=3031326 RepID=UPI0023D87762|nr:DUF3267 domain-containing protein [Cytobacillus sp. S13-E01]MDF0726907.1 DUF3267 domain-containing protein [Cytobacillus sp. S13-E01]
MTCWRTINLSKDYGFDRIVLMSLLTMFFAFVLFYLPLNLFNSTTNLNEDGVLLFTLGLLFIFPIHKFLHALPLIILRKKVKIHLTQFFLIIPVFSIRPKQTLSKSVTITAITTPFFLITFLMLLASLIFPGYIHYFSILAAINIGLCVSDFICLTQFIHAPKTCLIEEIEDGYTILVEN